MTLNVRPLGTSVTVYVAPVVAFPSCPKVALAAEDRLMLSGSLTLPAAPESPGAKITAPPQVVVRNCKVLVVWATHTGPFDLIASCRPSLRYALTTRAPAWARAFRR